MKMRRTLQASVILGALFATTVWAADVEILEQIIAKVNGDVVLSSDLRDAKRGLIQEFQGRGLKGPELQQAVDKAEKDVLRDKIDELLLLQKGKQMNIDVDNDVSKRIAQMQVRFKQPDPDKFQEFIRKQTGMSYEDFREKMKDQAISQHVLGSEVYSKIQVPREEMLKYYNEHKDEFQRDERVFLQEILIATGGTENRSDADAKKKAEDLVKRARSGEKFNELAMEYSDSDTAAQGGDLGAWRKTDLRPEMANAIWDKERGYVTDPFKIDTGYLILRVVEHHHKGLATFEEVENEIGGKLMQPLYQPKVREFLSSLREDAYLEIRDGWVDTGAVPGKDTSWIDPAKLTPQTVTKEEVAKQTRRRRLLWLIPIPGTSTTVEGKSSSK